MRKSALKAAEMDCIASPARSASDILPMTSDLICLKSRTRCRWHPPVMIRDSRSSGRFFDPTRGSSTTAEAPRAGDYLIVTISTGDLKERSSETSNGRVTAVAVQPTR